MPISLKSRLLMAALPLALLAPTAAALADDAGTIETVVVTASRRAESAQNVGGGLTALSGNDLAQIHATSFTGFAATVPSLTYASGGPTTNLIAVRGVTSGSAQKGAAVGIYLDDVPIGSSTQFGIGSNAFNFDLSGMQRVEVLDGPQGTLYGATTLGGAIKYVTAKPELGVFDGSVELEGSSTEHGSLNDGVRLMANIPFGENWALRLDGAQEYDSGYTQDPAHNRKNVGAGETYSGRASLLGQLTPDLQVRLTVLTQNDDGRGANVVLKDFTTHQPTATFYTPTGAGPYNQYYPLSQPANKHLNLYSGVLDWDLHWAKLTSVTAYQYNYFSTDADVSSLYGTLLAGLLPLIGSTVPTPPFALPTEIHTGKFTQEVRLQSPDNHHFEWVVGGFFTRESTVEKIELVDGLTQDGTVPGVSVPGYSVLPFYGYLPSSYRELAFFGDATYYVTPRFDMTVGVRYSEQHQTYYSYLQTILFYPNYYQTFRYPTTGSRTSDQSVVTYLFNPRYRITDDTMVYAKVSSGFRPGGPNFVLPGPVNAPPTFAPDKLWNYEIGEKSTLLDGKAILNFDLYDIEWTDIQTTASIGGINQLVNAGNAQVQGAETSFSYRVLPPLTLSGSASYTDAHLLSLTSAETSYLGLSEKGARLPLSPRFNFSLSASYAFELGNDYSGALSVNDAYVGSRFSAFNVGIPGQKAGSGAPNYKLAAYNTVNLNAALYMPRDMELDFYVKNVFDTEGEVSANPFENQYLNPYYKSIGLPYAPVPVVISQPRTIGLVFKIHLGDK